MLDIWKRAAALAEAKIMQQQQEVSQSEAWRENRALCRLTFPPRVPQHGVSHHNDGPPEHVSQDEDMKLL